MFLRCNTKSANCTSCSVGVRHKLATGQHALIGSLVAMQATAYLVEKVVRSLLAAVVGDSSAVLRRQVLSALYDTPALEHYLAQPDKCAIACS